MPKVHSNIVNEFFDMNPQPLSFSFPGPVSDLPGGMYGACVEPSEGGFIFRTLILHYHSRGQAYTHCSLLVKLGDPIPRGWHVQLSASPRGEPGRGVWALPSPAGLRAS